MHLGAFCLSCSFMEDVFRWSLSASRVSAMGFEAMRTRVQWFLSPHLNHSGKLTSALRPGKLISALRHLLLAAEAKLSSLSGWSHGKRLFS